MIESTPSQRTVLVRISDATNKGRQYVQLASGYSVVYNQDPPITLLQAMGNHAKQNDGHLLVPFNGHISLKNIIFCKHFVLLATSGEYIAGDIVGAGQHYRRGVSEDDIHTIPPEYVGKKAGMWLRADNVTYGTNFDPTPYVLDDFRDGNQTRPLVETLKNSKCTAMIAYNLDVQEGDDFYE